MDADAQTIDTRLAIYGTLAPGRANHHQLADLKGSWLKGHVHGHLKSSGWGAELGFPGIVLDPKGDAVEVELLESDDLPDHWARLDAFEGDGYSRQIVDVTVGDRVIKAWIYELAER